MKDQIAFRKGYKYQLAEDYGIQIEIYGHNIKSDFISLNESGFLWIYKGYAWDGPSGPTIDTKTFMLVRLVCDALYQLIREGKLDSSYREYADDLIKKICLEDKMCEIRAWWVYKGLDKFADFAADPKNKKKIIYAP